MNVLVDDSRLSDEERVQYALQITSEIDRCKKYAQDELSDFRCEVHGDSLTMVICLARNLHCQVIGFIQLKGCCAPFLHDVYSLHFDSQDDGFWDQHYRAQKVFEKLLRENSGEEAARSGAPLVVVWPKL